MSYGLGAYKKTSVKTASKEQILLMLYQSAIKNCKKAIEAIEKNKNYKITVMGEPQMGKRQLYPTLSTKDKDKDVRLMMNFISFCDGHTPLLKIAEHLKQCLQ